MSCGRLEGRLATAIPIPTPIGLEILNMILERTKLLTERSDWAILSPRLNAITALWTMTAIKMDISWAEFSCSPIAMP